MAVLTFQDLSFEDEPEDKRIKVAFLKIYFSYISYAALEELSSFKVNSHQIEFDCSEKKAQNKFNLLLADSFNDLKCALNGVRTVYIHRNSGIPLVGEGVFGLIDRNTNCIEVKPLTCCNLDCTFCSVDAGPSSRKARDFVIEAEYLVEEFNKLVAQKKHPVEAHIGPQGEPLLYAPLVDLIRGLRMNPKVRVISIDTNGTMLTRQLIDRLAEAGLTRLNVSLQAIDPGVANKLAGRPYNVSYVLEMIKYARTKLNVLLAPVMVPGHNDDQIERIIDAGREGGPVSRDGFPVLGIQNFLNYKRGRNPVSERSWDEFYAMLEDLEKKKGLKLKLAKEDFGILPDAKLEKPFQKRDMIKAVIVADGPNDDEKIAVHRDRAIIVEQAKHLKIGSTARMTVIRDKHNIFRAVAK